MSKIHVRLLARAGKRPSWLSSDQNSAVPMQVGCVRSLVEELSSCKQCHKKTSREVLCQGQGQKVEGEKAIHLVVFGLKKHLTFALLYMNEQGTSLYDT